MGEPHWKIEFYEKSNNRFPIDDFFKDLSKQDVVFVRKAIDRLAEHGDHLVDGRHAKILRDKIYELRVRNNHGYYRLFYFFFDGLKIIITHGYSKKSSAVDPNQIDKAIEYRKDYYESHKE